MYRLHSRYVFWAIPIFLPADSRPRRTSPPYAQSPCHPRCSQNPQKPHSVFFLWHLSANQKADHIPCPQALCPSSASILCMEHPKFLRVLWQECIVLHPVVREHNQYPPPQPRRHSPAVSTVLSSRQGSRF